MIGLRRCLAVEALFDVPVVAVATDAPVATPGVQSVAAARARRREERAAGRRAAAEALSLLGVAPKQVPTGVRGAPVWPAGVTGSIAHGAGVALAVVSLDEEVAGRGIGVDVEAPDAVGAELWRTLLTDGERAALAASGGGVAHATLLFGAKEATIKSLAGRSEGYVEMMELEVRPRPAQAGGGRWRWEVEREGQRVATGASAHVGGRLVSAAVSP